MTSQRIKGQGHKPLTDQLAKDWQQMFIIHPNAFDALLYKPVENPVSDTPTEEQPLFGQLNDHQEKAEYDEPVPCAYIEVKSDDDSYLVSGDDGVSLGMGESQVFQCRLSELVVPDGSVLEYGEMVGDRIIYRWWYVLKSKQVPYSHIGSAKIYYCVPFGDLESALRGGA